MSVYVDIEKDLGGFLLKTRFEAGDEVLALLGGSGCGKSLTLKCIAGIERPDRGRIVVDGVTLFDSENHINLTPQERRTGLMFQNYALFPNMTVLGNIRAGARREQDKDKREESVREYIRKFGLEELQDRYPNQISGGQQQRVALARILVSAPRILLLDEPFSALDSHLRFRLEREMKKVAADFGKTVILVSHDRDEVFRLSDKIAVMDRGRIETFGTRDRVFDMPETVTAAILTGCKNISPCCVTGEDRIEVPAWGLELSVPQIPKTCTHVGVRMHHVLPGDGENAFDCELVERIENPFSYTLMLRPVGGSGDLIGSELPKEEWDPTCSGTLRFHIPHEKIQLLREEE